MESKENIRILSCFLVLYFSCFASLSLLFIPAGSEHILCPIDISASYFLISVYILLFNLCSLWFVGGVKVGFFFPEQTCLDHYSATSHPVLLIFESFFDEMSHLSTENVAVCS